MNLKSKVWFVTDMVEGLVIALGWLALLLVAVIGRLVQMAVRWMLGHKYEECVLCETEYRDAVPYSYNPSDAISYRVCPLCHTDMGDDEYYKPWRRKMDRWIHENRS